MINRTQREIRASVPHRGRVLWLTGLSGAGKTTLATAVECALHHQNMRTYVLDGDRLRSGLCADLGFTEQDRAENTRRVGELSKLFVDAGLLLIVALISPLRASRDQVRQLHAPGDFLEVHCAADLATCETRDVKGLYRQARAGLIQEFTGISSPYEAPLAPDLVVDTGQLPLDVCVEQVLQLLREP